MRRTRTLIRRVENENDAKKPTRRSTGIGIGIGGKTGNA
jgi:hypothetical protein